MMFTPLYRTLKACVLVRQKPILESMMTLTSPSSSSSCVGEMANNKKRSLESLEEALNGASTVYDHAYSRMKKRIAYLRECETNFNQGQGGANSHKPPRRRLDMALLDFMLAKGRFETAIQWLRDDGELANLVDVEPFETAQNVVQALRKHNLAPAIAWCDEHRAQRAKLGCTLMFQLRVQEMVEMVSAGGENVWADAIKHARKHLATSEAALADSEGLARLTRAMLACLVFGGGGGGLVGNSPAGGGAVPTQYAKLFAPERWDALIERFVHMNHALHALRPASSEPLFTAAVRAGAAALKRADGDVSNAALEDPLRDPHVAELASSLPTAKAGGTRLVCRITGTLMSGDNLPLACPSGHVYGAMGVNAVSERTVDGCFVDPITSAKYHMNDMRRVYIM